jgi:hypothetical protein
MHNLVLSPITALIWDIWLRHRKSIWAVIALFFSGWFFNLVIEERVPALNVTLTFASLILVFAIFSYTEFDRLFPLPVSTLVLVAVPVANGVSAVALVYLGWVKFFFTPDEVSNPAWTAFLIGAFMVLYQAILWILARFSALRMIVIGIVGMTLNVVSLLPSFPRSNLSESFLASIVATCAVIAFLTAWIYIGRQRSGGAAGRGWIRLICEHLADRLPRRNKPFRSPAGAQFWFEWRRGGLMLPVFIGGLLVFVIGPLSWYLRNEPGAPLRILVTTLAMPIILALPVGKAFSKPDLWSSDLSVPSFVAVRPLATGELVIVKMKVAALSAAISWLLVFAFLLLGPAQRPPGENVRWVAPVVIAGIFLTWRFLVGGLWIGLSGNTTLFTASAVPHAFTPFVGIIGIAVLLRRYEALPGWIDDNLNFLLVLLTFGIIAKFSLWIVSWRDVAAERVQQYFVFWTGSTLGLMALGVSVWRAGRLLLVLVAILIVPLARIGFAPSALMKNRHR